LARRWSISAAVLVCCFSLALLGGTASAALQPAEALTYLPTEAFYSQRSPAEIDERLAQLQSYGIGQALLNTPRLKRNGTLKLKGQEGQMIPLWAQRAAIYGAAHGTAMSVVAVLNGVPKGGALDFDKTTARAHVIAAAEELVALGAGGVQLDIEPFPTSPGFVALLEELHEALVRRGFTGRLSVVAPANLTTWRPSYLAAVAAPLQQIDPTFYDSESTSRPEYEGWVREGLSYYSANVPAGVRVIPVIPSYGPNPWHVPAVENIANATAALEAALGEGSRVNGAGIWWWYGFYENEGRRYNASADRAAWLGSTLELPFTP
jgi:hypothetical protein